MIAGGKEGRVASAVLEVFDPPMCCTTGVCGPAVDERLVRFAADLEWVAARGVIVRRFNAAQEPGAFVTNRTVRRALQERGSGCLPLVLVGGSIVASGEYPGRAELLRAAGISEGSGGEV